MRSVFLIVLAILMLAGQAMTQDRPGEERRSLQNWVDPDLGRALIEGVGTARHLWIRGASNKVVRFDRETGERSVAAENVIDIMADGPHLWALSTVGDNQSVVSDLRQPDLSPRPVYYGGSPIGLFATEAGPGVLTTTRILTPVADGWSRRLIAGSLDRPAHVSGVAGDSLFVGYNRGEWGGGLRRIDVSTGAVSIVREPSDDRCGGRLNPECSPVVGIVSDNHREGCVLVGASLAHLMSRRGEVIRVCGSAITPVFSEALPVVPGALEILPGQTWPFDGLVAVDEGWVAVGQDRFARFTNGVVEMRDMPALRSWAGLKISDQVDDVIFVEGACCWGSENFVQRRVIAIPVID